MKALLLCRVSFFENVISKDIFLIFFKKTLDKSNGV